MLLTRWKTHWEATHGAKGAEWKPTRPETVTFGSLADPLANWAMVTVSSHQSIPPLSIDVSMWVCSIQRPLWHSRTQLINSSFYCYYVSGDSRRSVRWQTHWETTPFPATSITTRCKLHNNNIITTILYIICCRSWQKYYLLYTLIHKG